MFLLNSWSKLLQDLRRPDFQLRQNKKDKGRPPSPVLRMAFVENLAYSPFANF